MGEYAESIPEIQQTVQELRKVLGEIPILASEQRLLDEAGSEDEKKEEVRDLKNFWPHALWTEKEGKVTSIT